jgi:H+/gluconate symporter-like permease
MRFSIGEDLGAVLAKGIVMSLLTVVFFEPVLAMLLKNKFDKWQHKSVNLHFRKPIKLAVKYRTAVVIVMLALLLPVILIQSDLGYGYLDFMKTEQPEGEMYDMIDAASNQIVLVVPFEYTENEMGRILLLIMKSSMILLIACEI